MAASAAREGDANITGRLHFDRNENLMAVVAGKKIFHLFDPSLSEFLYADLPLRSGSYSAKIDSFGNVDFTRNAVDSSSNSVEANTYSPVDIRTPNYALHPKYRVAESKKIDCVVEAGDILYLPSHWWHQVDSFGDSAEEKTVAVNYFFEPFYNRPLYKASIPMLQRNRYYR
jgi:jumonji domain-containing protein 7